MRTSSRLTLQGSFHRLWGMVSVKHPTNPRVTSHAPVPCIPE